MHPQTQMAMGKLLERLAGNPKTRAEQVALIQKLEPNYRPPADVAIAQLEQRQNEARTKDKSEEQTEKRKRNMSAQRKKLLDDGLYDEETLKDIESTVMKKYPTIDWNDATKLYATEDGPAQPPQREREGQKFRHGQTYEFPSIPGLLDNPAKAATDMAYSMIDGFRSGALRP